MKKEPKKARSYSSLLLKKLLDNRNELETNRTRNRMLLAARIGDLLKEKGWKKKELAEKLNKKPSVITKWLSGTHNFTSDTLSDLEYVFGEKFLFVKEQKKELKYVTVYKTLKPQKSVQISEPSVNYGEKVENKIHISYQAQA